LNWLRLNSWGWSNILSKQHVIVIKRSLPFCREIILPNITEFRFPTSCQFLF
jgi:hypothetical protein